jgi:hypothetical protein
VAKGESYLSPETEPSEEPSTLPPPELNPLLNPLLADNMGRWAQVYFTSPPEKRDEAVHELLRELQAEQSGQAPAVTVASSSSSASFSIASSAGTSSSVTEPTASPASPPSSLESQVHTTLVRCLACGRKNPSTQRFCGLCGTRLGEDGPRDDLRGDLPIGDLPIEGFQSASPQSYPRSDHDVYEPAVYEPPANRNDLSLFQSIGGVSHSDEDSDQILSTPDSSGSFRIYVIFVVAIFLGVIAYLAWRSGQSPQAKHPEPSSPPNITEQPSDTAPVPGGASKTDVPAKADVPGRTPPTEALKNRSEHDAAKPSRNKEEARGRPDRAAAISQRNLRPQTNSPTSALAASGVDELAVAQGYLNGTNGQGRNSGEAAKWLWKAIAKHNANATFLLSDLYLKGDGVSKNCDQARILLDSAALKGVKGAGERLRHLQAFGCQ